MTPAKAKESKEGRKDIPDGAGYVSGYKEKDTYDDKVAKKQRGGCGCVIVLFILYQCFFYYM